MRICILVIPAANYFTPVGTLNRHNATPKTAVHSHQLQLPLLSLFLNLKKVDVHKGVAGAGRLPSLLAAAAYCITPYLLRLTIYLFMNVLVGWWLRQARFMAGCPVPRLAG